MAQKINKKEFERDLSLIVTTLNTGLNNLMTKHNVLVKNFAFSREGIPGEDNVVTNNCNVDINVIGMDGENVVWKE